MQVTAAKVVLAARCDVHKSDHSAATGMQMRAEIEGKVRMRMLRVYICMSVCTYSLCDASNAMPQTIFVQCF